MGNSVMLTTTHKLTKGHLCLKYDVWSNPLITFNNESLFIQNKITSEISDNNMLYFDGFKYELIEINVRKISYKMIDKKYIFEANFVHKNANEFCPVDYIVVTILLKKSQIFWNNLCELDKIPNKIFDNENKTYRMEVLNLKKFVKTLDYEKLIKYSLSKKYFKDFKSYNVKFIILESLF
jgi:carbonic anhydrase